MAPAVQAAILPDARRLTPRLGGIIDPRAAAEVRGKLEHDYSADVLYPLQRFNEKRPDSKRLIRTESMRVLTVDDIIEVHGLGPLARDEERIFRTAYVLVAPEEPTEEQIEIADNWVQEIGCQKPVTETKYSFEEPRAGSRP